MRNHIFLFPNSMTLTVYLCLHVTSALLLLLLLCFSASCLGTPYETCRSDNQTCGDVGFGYPFGIFVGCGDPDFQLRSCDSDDHPLLNIGGNEYHILEPYFLGINSNPTMTIVNDNLWGAKCNLSGNYSQFWSASNFHISSETYTNLTLWGHCNGSVNKATYPSNWSLCEDDWYYYLPTEPELTSFCQTALKLPFNTSLIDNLMNQTLPIDQTVLQGFQITWQVDTNRYSRCADCLRSNGICGYSISEPTTFLCHCSDGTSPPDKCGSDSHSTHTKAIVIGCSIGVALTAIAVVLLWLYFAKRRKPLPGSSTSKVEKFLKQYVYEMPTRYSQSDLKKITNNFVEKLGEGGFGVVYKGKLRNGTLVAVKLLDRHRHSESTQFMNEVATIGRLHHVNLVRLLGYCFESPTSALVYEYMVNGSLEKIIFAGKEKGQILMWEQLHSIALGAARGIAYLHQDCEKRIIHFDIKPHNILLDADFAPKVSDFGLAKLCEKGDVHISMSAARGTPGYVAPELCDRDHGSVTDKADVYSFGMLLLEIVGGRKNIEWKVSRSSQFYFPEWAFKLLESGELGMRLRRGGEMEAEDDEMARRLTKVGLWCIQYNYRDRPSMSRVVQMLEGNGDDVASPPLPLNSSTAAPEKPLLPSTERSCSSI